MLFPVLRPRTAEIIDETRLAGNQFGRPALRPIDDSALYATLDEIEAPVRIIESGTKLPWRHRMQRPDERLRIVERRIHGDCLAIGARGEGLDCFEITAVLEHRV